MAHSGGLSKEDPPRPLKLVADYVPDPQEGSSTMMDRWHIRRLECPYLRMPQSDYRLHGLQARERPEHSDPDCFGRTMLMLISTGLPGCRHWKDAGQRGARSFRFNDSRSCAGNGRGQASCRQRSVDGGCDEATNVRTKPQQPERAGRL
jgi:hypothetical protein